MVLTAGNYLSAILGAVSSIFVARVLGRELFGVYSLVLVVPGLLQLFLGLGVNVAVIRFSAAAIAAGNPDEARRYSLHATLFVCLTGIAISLFNLLLPTWLSTVLIRRPELASLVQLSALSTAGVTLLQIVSFTGIAWNRMAISSTYQVVQAVVKLALSPALVLLGFGVAGALVGHIVSLLAAGMIGTAAIYMAGLLRRGGPGHFLNDVKKMVAFGFPPYSGTLLYNLSLYFGTVVLASIATNAQVGLYSVAQNFLLPATLVSASLVNSLFPAFTSYDQIGGDAKVAFRLAYKFVAFVLTPLVVFLIPSATLLIRTLYGAEYAPGAQYLVLFALAYVPLGFGYTVHPAFFNGFGRPRLTFVVYLSGAVAMVVGAPLFAIGLGYGANGVIYATFVSLLVSWAVGTYLASSYMKASFDMKSNGAIIVSVVASYLATAFLPAVAHSTALSLLLDAAVFFGAYLTLAPLTGAVVSRDIDVMQHTFADLRVLGGFFGLLLRYEKFILSIRS